jgi:hypothetical protein
MSAIRKRLYYVWKKSSEKQRRKKYEGIYFKEDYRAIQYQREP